MTPPLRNPRPRSRSRLRSTAGFTISDVLIAMVILSLSMAVLVPRLTQSKRSATSTAIGNDLRTFAAAFDTYAQEHGSFPAEADPGLVPTDMGERLNAPAWLRLTPIGGRYNWDNNQTHYGVKYRAVIQISSTDGAPVTVDVELWEAIDRAIDDGNLSTGLFRLGAEDEPIYIVAI